MSQAKSVDRPSRVYVFVVLSLAAFLTLFTFFRAPGITYQTQVTFRPKSAGGGPYTPEFLRQFKSEIESKLLAPAFVLDAMRKGGLIQCDTTPETLKISGRIAERMQVHVREHDSQLYGRITLATERPESGLKLLDSMLRDIPSLSTCANTNAVETRPAVISGQRGGSVTRARLMQLGFLSSLFGLLGLVLASRIRPSTTLLTRQEVSDAAGVPVVADFAAGIALPQNRENRTQRRTFSIVLRAAELAVAAVFFLMVFHLATRDAMATRFVADPLAAYGEMVASMIG